MNLCVRFVRGLGIAGFVLGGIVLNLAAVSLTARAAYAQTLNAQSVNSIVVEGNRRVEASTVRSYFKPGAGGRLDAQVIDDAYKALYATGLFQDVRISQSGGRIVVTLVENPVINRIAFEGNKKVKEDQLKLEIQSKERGTLSRADRSVRRAAPGRGLPARRPLRRPYRAEDHRAAEQPRRPGLRDHRGREDRRQDHQLRRQPRLFVVSPQGRDQDRRNRPARLPADRQHLRPRPHRGRPRAAAALLSQARLYRCPDRVGGGRVRPGPARLHHHLHHRRGRAVPDRHRRRALQDCGAQPAAAGAAPADVDAATSTTPKRSRNRSRT